MADLTSSAPLRVLGEAYTEKFILDTVAARQVYRGQPMIIDQDVDTANVVQFVDAVVVAATDVFVGIAAEDKAVLISAPETTEIECYVAPTILGFKSAVFADGADLGKPVYMSDSATLSGTVADNPVLGKVHRVIDGYCYVELSSPAVCSGA
jgi:hypothetical protein